MDYNLIYKDLCKSRLHRGTIKEVGFEVHHILPKSLGGSDSSDNLVKFTIREHIFAHKLLCRIGGNVSQMRMKKAYYLMTRDGSILARMNSATLRRNKEGLPLSVFTHCVDYTKYTSKYLVKYKQYISKNRHTKEISYIFDLCIYASFWGYTGLQSLSSSDGRPPRYVKPLLISLHIINLDGSFTNTFLNFVNTIPVSKFKRFHKDLYKGIKSNYIKKILDMFNTTAIGNTFTVTMVDDYFYLYKLLPIDTVYDKYLYKKLSKGAIKSMCKSL